MSENCRTKADINNICTYNKHLYTTNTPLREFSQRCVLKKINQLLGLRMLLNIKCDTKTSV